MAKVAIDSFECSNSINNCRSFETHGALWATDDETEMATRGVGQLPEPWATPLKSALRETLVSYVVYSYQTPILWVMYDGTVISPAHKYSVTTSRHQNLVRSNFQADWIIDLFHLVSWSHAGYTEAHTERHTVRFFTAGEAARRRADLATSRTGAHDIELGACASADLTR